MQGGDDYVYSRGDIGKRKGGGDKARQSKRTQGGQTENMKRSIRCDFRVCKLAARQVDKRREGGENREVV
jgi:hypothetical protein